MSRTLHQTDASTTVAEVATIMARSKVGSALVMDGDRLIGIFTERDMVRAVSNSPDAPADPVGHWMTPRPHTVDPDVDAGDALATMLGGGYRHLPVTHEGRVMGMVSMRDLARAGVEGSAPPRHPERDA